MKTFSLTSNLIDIVNRNIYGATVNVVTRCNIPRTLTCNFYDQARPTKLTSCAFRRAAVCVEDADGVPPADARERGRILRGGAAALQRPRPWPRLRPEHG